MTAARAFSDTPAARTTWRLITRTLSSPTAAHGQFWLLRDAARQAEHHGRLAAQMFQPGGEPPPGIITISESHHNPRYQAFPPAG